MKFVSSSVAFGKRKTQSLIVLICRRLYRAHQCLDDKKEQKRTMYDNLLSMQIYGSYQYMAGLASVFELNVRLEANIIDEMESLSMDQLNPLIEAFVKHYAGKLKPGESDAIVRAQNLRNKISHGDFKALFGKFKGHPNVAPGKATMLKLDGGVMKPVKDTTKREGRLFGWMLEAATNGTFAQAVTELEDAIKIVRRLGLERATGK